MNECCLPILRLTFATVLMGMSTLPIAMAYADEPPCAGTDLSVAQASMVDAKKAIDASIAAIDNPSQSDLSNLATWLGVHSSSDSAIVRDKLVATRTYTDGAVFLCANSTDIGLGDIYAYVRPDNSFVIVLGIFFTQAPPTGFNSKLGTLVHEMSHFVLAGATKDIVYGIDGAKNLAATNPSAARQNADNYEYFVEATVFGLK